MLSAFENSAEVAWYAELGGRYQFACSICARTPLKALRYLEELLKPVGTVMQRAFGSVVSVDLISKQFLAPRAKVADTLTLSSDATLVDCDELDQAILTALLKEPDASIARIAERIGSPRTTVRRRVEHMHEIELIKGWIYLINARKLERATYRLLLTLKSSSDKIRSQMRSFCCKHSEVVALLTVVGSWDFELTVEVLSPNEMTRVIDKLAKLLESNLLSVETLQVFQQHQPKSYRWGICTSTTKLLP